MFHYLVDNAARHDHEELQRLDKPEYRDYRAEAQLYWAQWKESMAKAREAHSRRNGAVAAHYSSQVREASTWLLYCHLWDVLSVIDCL